MNLNVIISQLRLRVPEFQDRVAGAANFTILQENQRMAVPAAYVLPMDENPEENKSVNGYRQNVRDGFAVVVVISNVAEERGQTAMASVHDMRTRLFKALLGFEPGEDYDGIEYEGGNLLSLDRARLYYQFEFAADYEIAESDTWRAVRDSELPDWEGLDINLDMAPADGQIDAKASIDISQD